MEFEIKSVENMNGTDSLPVIFDIKSKRVKKGIFGIMGKIVINDDFSKYDVSMIAFMIIFVFFCFYFFI